MANAKRSGDHVEVTGNGQAGTINGVFWVNLRNVAGLIRRGEAPDEYTSVRYLQAQLGTSGTNAANVDDLVGDQVLETPEQILGVE